MLTTFDRLVLRGCERHWCWRLYCTTCGNMEFRNGMELIGMGRDPLADGDASLRDGLRWHDDPEEIAARTVALGCQVATANVNEFFRRHDGIDWLGFMGLALWRLENFRISRAGRVANEPYSENRELLLKLISNSWSTQFYSMFLVCREHIRSEDGFDAVGSAMGCCKDIIRGKRPRFGISDLEIMEGAIYQLLEHRRTQPSAT